MWRVFITISADKLHSLTNEIRKSKKHTDYPNMIHNEFLQLFMPTPSANLNRSYSEENLSEVVGVIVGWVGLWSRKKYST